METTPIKEAITWLEKSNADLEPELLSADGARALLNEYARAEKLAAYGRRCWRKGSQTPAKWRVRQAFDGQGQGRAGSG